MEMEQDLEVKTLNRTQKHQLRAILLGPSGHHQAKGHGQGHGCGRSSLPPSFAFGSESGVPGGAGGATTGTAASNTALYHSTSAPIPLQIFRSAELIGEKVQRVADPEIEALKKQRLDHIFTDGEEKLRDLQQSLLKATAVPVPAVEEIEEERYNRMYPVLQKPWPESVENVKLPQQKRLFVRTTGPPPSGSSASGSSGEDEFDYDLDDEDYEFLSQKRKQDPNFRVTDNLFESVITWFLTHKVQSAEEFLNLQCATRPSAPPQNPHQEDVVSSPHEDKKSPPPYRPYPICLISHSDLDAIIGHFLAKQKRGQTTSTSGFGSSVVTLPPAWQPSHVPQPASPNGPNNGNGRKSSPSNKKQRHSIVPPSPRSATALAYKIFRPPLPKIEPKVLRSHNKQSSTSLVGVNKLLLKADWYKGFTTNYKRVMQYHFHKGLQQWRQTLHNLKTLEETFALDDNDNGEDALSKFYFGKRVDVVGKTKDVDNNNNDEGGTSAQDVMVTKVDNMGEPTPTQIQSTHDCSATNDAPSDPEPQPQQLPLPTLKEIAEVISSVACDSSVADHQI